MDPNKIRVSDEEEVNDLDELEGRLIADRYAELHDEEGEHPLTLEDVERGRQNWLKLSQEDDDA